MDLKLKDVAKILQVSEKTVYRWINAGKIPYYRLQHQYRFKTDEINQWAMQNKIDISKPIAGEQSSKPVSVLNHLHNGGIFYQISGQSVEEVLRNSVQLLPLPAGLNRGDLLTYLIEREEMMSTGIGSGVAFPHPRNPLVPSVEDESLSIVFLHKPVDYQALDNVPVHTLFVILSADVTRHLRLLSQLTYLCKQPDFLALLKQQAVREDILTFIQAATSDLK